VRCARVSEQRARPHREPAALLDFALGAHEDVRSSGESGSDLVFHAMTENPSTNLAE